VPYHVCGAQQDNSTACLPSTGGDTLYPVGGGESGYIAPDPLDTDVFYAGSYGGLLTRINRRTGERRTITIWPDNPMGSPRGTSRNASSGRSRSSSRPTDPKTVYATSQHVWKTTNEGQSWTRISPDLSRADPSTMGPSGGPITLDQTGVETYATVFTLAPSPRDGQVIWAGSDDGLVHVTRDGGRELAERDAARLPEFTRISLIEASPHDPGDRLPRREPVPARRSRAVRLPDGGLRPHMDEDRPGLPGDDFARAIREDHAASRAPVPRNRDQRLRVVR
jgi:hypothetical protein